MPNSEVNLENIRQRPALIDRLPGLSQASGTAIYPHVYVGRELYANLVSDEPDQSNVALVLHEQEHIKRIKEAGAFKWYGRYVFSRTFRLEEELEATKSQFVHLKSYGIQADLEHRAKVLSSGLYLWPTNYEHAYMRLAVIWESASTSS